MFAKTIVVVPHVHWDREWYFSCEESQVLAVRDFGEVLDHLEGDPDYPSFVMDGQMAVVDEYLDTVPGARERVERLVCAGRLHVGPWFTQTDEMVVGGESIVRNLLYGFESSERLGETMMVGYVPDSFGQSAQMPMILNQFGIGRSVFWRGQSQFCGTSSSQFWWESADGSRVLANQLPLGYATGKYLPTDPEALRRRLSPLFATFDELASAPVAILPNGHDQMPIQENIDEVMEGLRKAFPDREFVLGSLDDELDLVESSASTTPLPTVAGEFLDGKRERVHRSIFSVRMDNKVANARVENRLARVAEPILAVAREVGLDYPKTLVDQAWKELLESHAHDSIGGCCSDKVNAEISARLANASERTDLLVHYYERYLAEAVDLPEAGRLVLFNMDATPGVERLVTAEVLTRGERFELADSEGRPVPFSVIGTEEVDPGLVDRQIVAAGNYEPFLRTTIQLRRELPTVGYEALVVREVEGARPETPRAAASGTFETESYRVAVNENGTIDLACKADGTSYPGMLAIEAEGNDGDEYDFSPLADGRKVLSSDVVSCRPTIVERELSVAVHIAYELLLPAGLDGWRAGASGASSTLGVSLDLEFDKASETVGIHVTLDNACDDLRVRLLVPTGIASSASLSDNQFGTIERPVVDPGMSVWEEERWSERPDAIFPFLTYVALADDARTVAVLTGSTREYEVVGDAHDVIAVTLLSCVGTLGKSDLVRRPGRPSGIAAPTPDGQCHGTLDLDLALVASPEPASRSLPATRAARWLTPVEAYQRFAYAPINISEAKAPVPARFSLLSQADEGIVLSAVKLAEDGRGIVARFCNPSDRPRVLSLGGSGVASWLTLAETPAEPSETVAPCSVATVLLSDPSER